MFILPDMDTRYYSKDLKDFISLKEMLVSVPEEEYPKSKDDLDELFYCFNIDVD